MQINLERAKELAEVLPVAFIVIVVGVFGCKPEEEGKMAKVKVAAISLSSLAFEDRGTMPKEYTADGADVSPPLQWADVPPGTRSIALVCEDPDAPGAMFVHWVIFNIDPSTRELPRGVPASQRLADGSLQGRNGFGKIGYRGPSPPRGPAHRYFFRIYALDTMLDLEAGAARSQLLRAMEGHVLAEGELMGRYGRQ